MQPAMGKLTNASHLGDVLLHAGFKNDPPVKNYKAWLISRLAEDHGIADETQWVQTLQKGGQFNVAIKTARSSKKLKPRKLAGILAKKTQPPQSGLVFTATPSIRFFDGRGANKPWLCEIPDPLSRIAWQTPVILHPDTARQNGIAQQDIIQIQTESGTLEAPVYLSETVSPFIMLMPIGQGHLSYGRYAQGTGLSPLTLLSAKTDPDSGGSSFTADKVSIQKTGRTMELAHTDGSRTQHGRTFALSVGLEELKKGQPHKKSGLTMKDFPLTLPLPEGYDPRQDFYPSHDHEIYRWGMVVDLDK